MPNETTPVKFSELTIEDVENYLHIDEISESDEVLLATILESAKSHVLHYTGRDDTNVDNIPELVIAVYAVCQNMYDKRTMEVDSSIANQVIESIHGCRSIKLL